MLVDPPLRYHLPQKGWIRLNRAIDEIPSIRHEFVDWLEYGVSALVPECTVMDVDIIQIDGGALSLFVDGTGLVTAPPPPGYESEHLYRQIAQCVERARRLAREALYALISDHRVPIYARKHEHDADLQLMPPFVWEMTDRRREMAEASAALPSGKCYYDIHLGVPESEPLARPDGLSRTHGSFVDWFAKEIEASPHHKTMKVADGDGSEVYDKAAELGVAKAKVETLKGIAYQRFPQDVVDVWRKSGRPAGNPPKLRQVK